MLIQYMLFECEIVKSLGIKVKMPVKAAIDNSGTVFSANGWSIGGWTRHVEIKTNFLQEMKEIGMFQFQWIPKATSKAGTFTKNLGGPEFNKLCESVCGLDNYYKNKKENKTPACESRKVSCENKALTLWTRGGIGKVLATFTCWRKLLQK